MKRLLFIVLITLVAAVIAWPQNPGNYIPGGQVLPGSQAFAFGPFQPRNMRLGLDLQGGTQLTLQADMSRVPLDQQEGALRGVVNVLERRVNAYGVAESTIQTRGTDRVIVQLPGVKDIEEAKQLVGTTALLEFKECATPVQIASQCIEWRNATGTVDGEVRELTGRYLVPGRQQVAFSGGGQSTGLPQVAFEFDAEGAQLFQQITSRLLGQPLGIFLDQQMVSAPTIQGVISNSGVITGVGLDEARLLAVQLNAGALPVPVSIEEERTVDATLGADSVRKSITAGALSLLVVIAFMIMYYRLPGVVAAGALIVYALISLAIFKQFGVTLTLAGIAGFILSLGMAVDANILIFERMKEELRNGRSVAQAIKAGEDRAWPSIRDSNSSTLITCAVLYLFGQQFGATIIMGFAVVLAIGVAVSLFSAIFVTRTFLELLLNQRWAHSSKLFGMSLDPLRTAPRFERAAAPSRG